MSYTGQASRQPISAGGVDSLKTQMPRFFFHYQYGDDKVLEDRVGTVLDDLTAVELEASSIAFEILTDELTDGGLVSTPRCLEVADEEGDVVVLYLPFWAALSAPEGDRANAGT